MRTKRLLAIAATGSVTALVLAACGGSSEAPASSAAASEAPAASASAAAPASSAAAEQPAAPGGEAYAGPVGDGEGQLNVLPWPGYAEDGSTATATISVVFTPNARSP